MKRTLYREQNGQVLVQVTLMMLVLMLFVALAVDVGHIYSERRLMQNAADAGALAGAWELCLGHGEAAAIGQAQLYASANGAQVADVLVNGNGVSVAASETTDMYFAGLIGIYTVTVSAEAESACGAANDACGIWPIALPLRVWEYYSDECWETVVIIDSEKICGDEVGELDCGPYEVSTGGDRAWLDFGQPDPGIYGSIHCAGNCGAAALKCWMQQTYPVVIDLPICIRGESGTIGSAFKEAGDPMHKDQIRNIPIFDSFTDSGVCPDGDDVLGDSCNNNRMYHIIDVACVQIDRYEPQYEIPLVQPTAEPVGPGTPTPEPTKTPKPEVVQALIVKVACGPVCAEGCGSTTGATPGPGYTMGVSLLR